MKKIHLILLVAIPQYLKTGQSTVFNTAILNEFADLGIYNYPLCLFLDLFQPSKKLILRKKWISNHKQL